MIPEGFTKVNRANINDSEKKGIKYHKEKSPHL